MKIKCPNCEGLTWKPGQFGEKVLCKLCKCTGVIESDDKNICSSCNGKGYIRKHSNHKETCQKCNGIGIAGL